MQITKLDYKDVPQFSKRDKAYVQQDAVLRSFYAHSPDLNSFAEVIELKKQQQIPRKELVDMLQLQYKNVEASHKVQKNISSLADENTFTIITGHQPSLATGPLYFIYKILSTINLTEQLSVRHPDKHFVPVYWMGSEDHDFEEINHFHLFGKTLTWENEEKGSVGKMSTKGILPVLEELKNLLGESENATQIYDLMYEAYAKHDTLDEATFYLTNALFQDYGLVVFITSSPKAKSLFVEYMLKEIIEQASYKIVNKTIAELEKAGFKAQASPREINLFYMRKGLRERIVQEAGVFKVLNTDFTFTKKEIEEELHSHPERFSPNVLMRPLYQEVLFPNLAYIGGGGELAYWLERKAQFEYFKVPFPMLIRRASVMWINAGQAKKLNQLGLSVQDIFTAEDQLISNFVRENTEQEVNLTDDRAALEQIYIQILAKAKAIDPALEKSVLGEQAKALKSLQQIETKLLRAEKRQHETHTKRITGLKDKLFPKRGLQERKDNFISFYLKYGDEFMQVLKKHIDALEGKMLVLVE